MNISNTTLDWNEYKKAAIDIVGEGCVLLENKENALPLRKGETVSVFGRIQLHYYKSGTGSGGMVNVSKVYGILEGLEESGDIVLNKELIKIYEDWEEENPFNEGRGWGTEPWSQVEMPLTEDVVKNAEKNSDTALFIIGRTAGEDQDFSDTKGAFRLSETEEANLKLVRQIFDRVVVLLNVGSLMNLDFIDNYKPDAVLIGWQGGMIGGLGTADVLTGKVNPSGHLTDTIAYSISDYPSNPYFGDPSETVYGEDIYVGYRYFETFAKEKVRYPFGYGLSYTDFTIDGQLKCVDFVKKTFTVESEVTNTGDVPGKQVSMVFVKAPSGKLGKAARVLAGFGKSKLLSAGETEKIEILCYLETIASFDDKNITEAPYSMLLEEGEYEIYLGSDVREAKKVGSFVVDKLLVIRELSSAAGPVKAFKRLVPIEEGGQIRAGYEDTPVTGGHEKEHRDKNIPEEIPQDFTQRYLLRDVLSGFVSMKAFVSQFTDDDLACIVRGEGMGSSLVTPGTASAFGGVSKYLQKFDIPAVCCDDGPSGMRLDSGVKAFSTPSATMMACTFNTDLVKRMYTYMGLEMIYNRVEVLLGPGMNIHRHPLNGRNFEYFSEDPYITGVMGVAMLAGLKKYGASGTPKHFCANNQEYGRQKIDSVVSERALREIYLKGFEIAVRAGVCDSLMTTYGQLNGIWTAGHYDLNTTILRDEWGFKGIVMTDWWANVNDRESEPTKNNTAAMVRAQNDLYMVVSDAAGNSADDNSLRSLQEGALTRGELQRSAMNICNFAMHSLAMKRLLKEDLKVEIVNGDEVEDAFDMENVEYIRFDGNITISLEDRESKAGTNYYIPLDIAKLGDYEIIVTGSSRLSELAQLPCTLYYTGVPFLTFTFHGTEGKSMSVTKEMPLHNRMAVFRLNVAKNGVNLEKIEFRFKGSVK